MTDREQNPAEKQAEKILEAEYILARAEECPQGAECPIHFRVDEEYFLEYAEYARLITYVGDYVVITDDNHRYEDPSVILKLVFGLTKSLPPQYETSILYVGEGTIGDISEMSVEDQRNSFRYVKEHDEWGKIRDEHEFVRLALEGGLIDASKPYRLEN